MREKVTTTAKQIKVEPYQEIMIQDYADKNDWGQSVVYRKAIDEYLIKHKDDILSKIDLNLIRKDMIDNASSWDKIPKKLKDSFETINVQPKLKLTK